MWPVSQLWWLGRAAQGCCTARCMEVTIMTGNGSSIGVTGGLTMDTMRPSAGLQNLA